jgi:hypothetical protein
MTGRPGDWRADSLDPGWHRALTGREVDAIERAIDHARAADPSLDPGRLGPEDFPIDDLADTLADLRERLVDGPGVVAWSGFPVERHDEDELRALWWGLGRAVGVPVAQSWRGDLIGDVRDLGTGIRGRTGRGYTSNTELSFHADAADVSGLFYLRTARHGGVNRVASAIATHDEIARRRPDLLEELYRPLPWSWQGNQAPGARAWYEMPVFGRRGDEISCAYVRTNILLAAENAGAPPLTGRQREAVQLVADVAAEPGLWVERTFEPGSMLWVHNHTVLHLRTAFVDWDEPERRRHLLRIWLSPPNNRALPHSFASFFGATGAGTVRGGYRSRDGSVTHRTV